MPPPPHLNEWRSLARALIGIFFLNVNTSIITKQNYSISLLLFWHATFLGYYQLSRLLIWDQMGKILKSISSKTKLFNNFFCALAWSFAGIVSMECGEMDSIKSLCEDPFWRVKSSQFLTWDQMGKYNVFFAILTWRFLGIVLIICIEGCIHLIALRVPSGRGGIQKLIMGLNWKYKICISKHTDPCIFIYLVWSFLWLLVLMTCRYTG